MILDETFFSFRRLYIRKILCRTRRYVTFKPKKDSKGTILLSFVTHPFTVTKKVLSNTPHTTSWECLGIAEELLERGFAVDIVDFRDTKFVPTKKYVAVIDVDHNLDSFSRFLPKDCIKIFYTTGAHWLYQNLAELKRLDELEKRRNVVLKPMRQALPSKNIENADIATALSVFSKNTYAYAKKDISVLPLFSNASFPSPENKNFEDVRKRFVWIGGGGAVHKGLDRVIECFLSLPEYHLTVCGPVGAEKDFLTVYEQDLRTAKNIEFVGRINVRGEQFKNIVDQAVAVVYPSCSEGCAGSVVVGMHAGLIPIVTYESGIPVEKFGIQLENAEVPTIRKAVELVSAMPAKELAMRSMSAWKYAQIRYTFDMFKKSFGAFIDAILK